MASPPNHREYAITLKYGAKQKPFRFPANELVSYVIKKGAVELQVDRVDRSDLVLVHLGYSLPKDSVLKDVLKNDVVTCCFLQISKQVQRSLTIADINNCTDGGKCLGYCINCEMIVQTRPVFQCKSCRKTNFELNAPVNFFEDGPQQFVGRCNDCNKTEARVEYICCNDFEREHTAVFLLHLRQNVLEKPCMKCEKVENETFKFHCNHTMCRFCFGSWCRMQLELDAFQQDTKIGYSIGCPGGGINCHRSLITDPHHFYLVDGKKKFYDEYHDKSFAAFRTQDKQLECHKCSAVLDRSQSQQADVFGSSSYRPNQPDGPAVPGSAWKKLFKKPSPPVQQQERTITRQQIKCSDCLSLYCGECTLIWHEGDCIEMSKEQVASANQFTVDPKSAAASEWK